MRTCKCCFDEEVLEENIITCPKGCEFCKSCVEKSVEVNFGEGKLDYNCLADCDQQFNMQTLQNVLKPHLFSKVTRKKQLQEIKAAGIEDLEWCPFCDFATIPVQGDRIFKCLNPDCMKESCRACKEPSHMPYRCEEVEKDDDVRKRTYVENQMTNALLRECYKCKLKFYKEEGCNKMTCSCGAKMCYICKQPVKDYKHFNGQGGDQNHLCPLYSDTHKMHEADVLRSAIAAKAEVGLDLKIDLAVGVQEHFRAKAVEHPPIPIPQVAAVYMNQRIEFNDHQRFVQDLRNWNRRRAQ